MEPRTPPDCKRSKTVTSIQMLQSDTTEEALSPTFNNTSPSHKDM